MALEGGPGGGHQYAQGEQPGNKRPQQGFHTSKLSKILVGWRLGDVKKCEGEGPKLRFSLILFCK
jgi:hypothetical protein